MSKSIVIIRETSANTGYGVRTKMVGAALTSSTNLRLYVDTYNLNTPPRVTWQVVEYENVKLQTGTKLLNADGATQAITSVDTIKSMLICAGATSTEAGVQDTDQQLQFAGIITNATTITFYTNANANTITVYWQVADFS
jgi:hypothetical protein